MYAGQIYEFLKKHILDPSASIIVTSIDLLPENPSLPLYCVVNEDVSQSAGTHWVCMYINDEKRGIFVDSFARRPLPEIERFLEKYTISFEVNRIQLQMSTSIVCGMFSSIALVEFSRHKSLKQFLSSFSPFNRYLNDLIIKNMYENGCIVNKFSA